MPIDGLAIMQNMWLEQDSIPRPRPPFIPYGNAYLGTVIGTGTFTKIVSGKPEYWEITMQVISGTATVCVRKDGGNWTQITTGAPTYGTSSHVTFTPSAALKSDGTEDLRVYINQAGINMSYYDVAGADIVQYTGLSAPTGLTLTPTGLTGTTFTQYYRVSANNAGGESAACASVSQAISTARDYWTPSTEYITVSWTAVSGADSYNIYTSDISGNEAYLATVSGVSFKDDGSIAINVFKPAPSNDSSAGPKLSTMINMDNQLFGCGDGDNPQFLWYSGQGLHLGDFSFNPLGGGYVGIDYGGDTIPTLPFAFHDGKGNPLLSVLSFGPAGYGKLYHVEFTTTTVGTTTLTYPSVFEANSRDGTPAPRGVAVYQNNAYYCTGVAFKTTGIKPNVINILSTDTISNQMIPDIQRLTLGSLDQIVAQEFMGRIYFAVPTGGSTTNNEVWVLDMTRGGLWILSWPISVTDMWVYQDNSGTAHLLTLQGGVCLELDLNRTSIPHQDNGTPFTSRLRTGALIFDKGGVAMFSSYFTYCKFLFPSGNIQVDVYGTTEDSLDEVLLASETLNASSVNSRGGYGQILYSDPTAGTPAGLPSLSYSDNIGVLTATTKTTEPLPLEIDDIVNQQSVEITCTETGDDYLLSSITTTGYSIPKLYLGQ